MKRGRGKGEAVSPNMPPRTAQPVTIEQAIASPTSIGTTAMPIARNGLATKF